MLTDDKLALIRARSQVQRPSTLTWSETPYLDRDVLLAEVDRLRKLLADRSADDELSRAVQKQRSSSIKCIYCSNLGWFGGADGEAFCTCPVGRWQKAWMAEFWEWHARPG